MASIDAKRLLEIDARLGDAAIDPNLWPQIMDEISAAVGARGAVLLQSDVRTADVPRTAGVSELVDNYFKSGWQVRDMRGERGVPMLLRGDNVFIDQDVVTEREVRCSPFYNECLAPYGVKWFAAIGFFADSALWAMAIQRTPKEGEFTTDDKRPLAEISRRLTDVATLSKVVGGAVLAGVSDALGLINEPALALDRLGFILCANAAAEQLFDDEFRVKNRRLLVNDQRAKSAIDTLIDRLRTTPDTAPLPVNPIVVSRNAKPRIVIRVLPVPGAARSPFLGARVLLVLSDLSCKTRPRSEILAQTFGLSRAEARLASLIATGISPQQAAEQLGLARETVRNQLKAVFAKTETHRQAELVALLLKL